MLRFVAIPESINAQTTFPFTSIVPPRKQSGIFQNLGVVVIWVS